jgi:hypothetical protein
VGVVQGSANWLSAVAPLNCNAPQTHCYSCMQLLLDKKCIIDEIRRCQDFSKISKIPLTK